MILLFFILILQLSTIMVVALSTGDRSVVRNETSTSYSNGTLIVNDYEDDEEFCPKPKCSSNDTKVEYDSGLAKYLLRYSCACYEYCRDFKNCCYDSPYYDYEEQRKPIPYEEVLVQPGHSEVYFVKNACSSSYNDVEITKKCHAAGNYWGLNIENIELKHLVTSFATNVTYRNIYCAICNGEHDLRFWTIEIEVYCENHLTYSNRTDKCKKLENANITNMRFDGSRWYFIHGNYTYKVQIIQKKPEHSSILTSTHHSTISSCSADWKDLILKNKCVDGTYSKVFDYKTNHKIIYKNKYCAYCNGVPKQRITCHAGIMEVASPTDQIFTRLFDYKMIQPPAICNEKNTTLLQIQKQVCPSYGNDTESTSTTLEHESWFLNLYGGLATTISLLFLIIHLIIFSQVEELHTIGGKNIASFCTALVLAYGSFLLGNLMEDFVCAVTAVITYYSFLCAFSWMLTISYDLWRTFWNVVKHLRNPSNPKKTFLAYSVWSWSIPMIPASISIYINWFSPVHHWIAPRFGGDMCWFGNGDSLLVFFVAPVCVVIIVNGMFFFHISYILFTHRGQSVGKKSSIDYKVYARIFVLTGFTWITGFVASYTQGLVWWIIFVFLNTFHGVFIFLAFSCKKVIILSFLKRIGMFRKWQDYLQKSIDKSKSTCNTKSTSNNVSRNTA